MTKKLLTSVALVGVLLGAGACSDSAQDGAEGASDSSASAQENAEQSPGGEGGQGQGQMPEPDTSDIPEVVAEVNGEELSGEEFSSIYETQFQQMAMQSQATGEEMDQAAMKDQTLDSMIGNELLLQQAADEGYEASDDDVQALLEEAAESSSGVESVDDLIQGYEDQGMSEEELREDARDQVLIDQVVEELDVEEPTEEELREQYDQSVAQQEAQQSESEEGSGEGESEGEQPETPPFEEVRDQLEEQMMSQRETEAVQAHVESLREDAEIEKHL